MIRLALVLAAAGVLLGACAAPTIDSGFVVRSDLRTTDCSGHPTASAIDATPGDDDPFNFLTRRYEPLPPPSGQPDQRLRVQDCTRPGETVLVAAGLKLQPGDVLHIGTGAVGPAYQFDGTRYAMHSAAMLAAPVEITLRFVAPTSGRLYADEDAFLAAALSMVARDASQKQSAPLTAALERHQVLLWNTLVNHLRLFRAPAVAAASPLPRIGLTLLVDYGPWCEDMKAALANPAADADRRELVRFFSGTDDRCPSSPSPPANREFSRVADFARSAVQAVGAGSRPANEGYYNNAQQALYTHVSANLKGARLGVANRVSTVGAWTLADWEHSGICRDATAKHLAIEAFRLADGKWVYVRTPNDETATVAVKRVFTQTVQERRFVEVGSWWQRWKLVMEASDLDSVYGGEIIGIRWLGEPAQPAMCYVHSAR